MYSFVRYTWETYSRINCILVDSTFCQRYFILVGYSWKIINCILVDSTFCQRYFILVGYSWKITGCVTDFLVSDLVVQHCQHLVTVHCDTLYIVEHMYSFVKYTWQTYRMINYIFAFLPIYFTIHLVKGISF